MGRRLVLTLVGAALVVLAAGCETVARLEIRAGGASTLTSTYPIEGDEVEVEGVVDFGQPRQSARDDPATFVERWFALESTDEPQPGFDWWGRDQAIVFGFLAFGLLVLVIAGSLGFLGFTRKLDKEGRRVRSGRWPRR